MTGAVRFMTVAIQTQALVKSFGFTRALDGIDLEVLPGTVLGLLGPNGSGKTTAVRILATLLAPSSGRASVGGYDVVTHAAQVRSLIGLTGQYAAVDGYLTGLENLELIGQLLDLSRHDADAARASSSPVSISLTRPSASRKRTQVACDAAWTSPPVWWADPKYWFWTSRPPDSIRTAG